MGARSVKAVRTPKWLYVHVRSIGSQLLGGGISPAQVFDAHGWPPRMLFDVESDPGLTRNAVDDQPRVEEELRLQLLNWLIDSENDVPAE